MANQGTMALIKYIEINIMAFIPIVLIVGGAAVLLILGIVWPIYMSIKENRMHESLLLEFVSIPITIMLISAVI